MMVTSPLPLLMVKGNFTSLSNMTVRDLETFIPFMVQCSLPETECSSNKKKPSWWPRVLPYRFPLVHPRSFSHTGYRKHLICAIMSCYQYHQQDYILQFCEQLSAQPGSVQMRANRDGTTSLYNQNNLHILTFNNQMLHYDQDPEVGKKPPKSPRRCLLPSKARILDVYLCENCDEEFGTKVAITAHERKCYGRDEVEEQPEPESTPLDLLGYLQLGTEPPPPSSQSSTRRVELSLTRNKLVEFSSLLGRRILNDAVTKRDLVARPEKLVQTYEAYCYVSSRPSKPRETYRFRNNFKRGKTREESYGRPYCFSRAQRMERYLTLKTGLNRESRRLLSRMKPLSVDVERCEENSFSDSFSPEIITVKEDPLATSPTILQDRLTYIPPPPKLYFKGENTAISNSTGKFAPTIIEVDLCSSDDDG